MSELPPGYRLKVGALQERSLLVKMMQRTYQELYPGGDFSHFSKTVEQFLSAETPLWWVESSNDLLSGQAFSGQVLLSGQAFTEPVGCLWLGNAIDQATGTRNAHIFLVYVNPAHRRRGIGAALVQYAEKWARARGDRQIGLQVFAVNLPAVNLYRRLNYETESLWMVKPL